MPSSRKGKIRGTWQLIRIIPVLSWSGGALAVGLGSSVRTGTPVNWLYLALIAAAGIIFQGLVSHAFNDRVDWASGTDRHSIGILSGGSKVIKEGIFSPGQLRVAGYISLAAGTLIALYFLFERGFLSLVFWGLAVWAGIAYSQSPFRLSYRPIIGELLAAFPAMAGFALGTHFILTGSLGFLPLWAGVLHGLFCTGWLMQHHIPDIPADLQAKPPKLTTVSWLYRQKGEKAARYPALFYFAAIIPAAIFGGIYFNAVFFFSILFCVPCLCLAWFTKAGNCGDVTSKQKGMILYSLAHSIVLSLLFAAGY